MSKSLNALREIVLWAHRKGPRLDDELTSRNIYLEGGGTAPRTVPYLAMVVLAFSIPFMVLAVAIAVVPVVVMSHKDHHLRRQEALQRAGEGRHTHGAHAAPSLDPSTEHRTPGRPMLTPPPSPPVLGKAPALTTTGS